MTHLSLLHQTMTMDIHVAIAILTQGNKVLMQLRDDIPNIIYPGHWGFFGGHLETGETPKIALEREIMEEISYRIPTSQTHLFGVYSDRLNTDSTRNVHRHVFQAPLTVAITELQLNEGWDMALLTRENALEGGAYSKKAAQWRPMPGIHQRILTDFFNQYED